jgi:Lrp/AsnC family transcriptional regulator for asnA, asnC and gidA
MNLDAINFEIIRRLRNGRKTAKAIADDIGVSHNTVRRRIESLIQNGILEIKGLVGMDHLPNHTLAVIGINLRTRTLTKRVQEICELEGVISAGVVTGRYDIIALIMLNNENDLLKFHTKEMPKIKDITFTETFVMYKNVNWKVPYVL